MNFKKIICPHCANDTFYAETEEKKIYIDIIIIVPKLVCTRCVKQVDNY